MKKPTKKNSKKLAGGKSLKSVKTLGLWSNHNESLLRG
jgi:hypothetical protein